MKIKRIQVHNVMGVKDVDADLEGHNLWLIGGKNRSGKSSTLQSLVMAICGKRGCDFPSEPLRDGEDEGWIKETTEALKAFTPKDVSAVQERISNSTAINRNVANKKRRDETREELAKQKKESHTLSGEIKLAEKAKAKAFKEAEWPVDGLAYDENGVTFNGLPFSQCSAAESIRVSIEMGMSLNPELKLLIVQHGECMDDETLEMVAKVVSEKDYQLLVEFMTRDADDEGRCQVVLEEGLVKELQPS